MIDEGELRRRFPEIPWDQPVEVRILGTQAPLRHEGKDVIVVGGKDEDLYHACRYCIALHGLKAQDVMHGRTEAAYPTREEALDHIEQVHHE